MQIIVSDALRQRRLAQCGACEHARRSAGVLRCGKCGCLMAVKAKFSQAQCPAGKWNNEAGH